MTQAHPVVAAALQQALVDLTDLSLQGKQAHWNIEGPGFRSLHLHLDEIIDEVRLAADDVAERMAAIEVAPDGRASQQPRWLTRWSPASCPPIRPLASTKSVCLALPSASRQPWIRWTSTITCLTTC